jgi:hypothetical protein
MLNLMKSKKLYLIFFCLIIFLFASLFLRDESKDHYNFEEVSNADSIFWLSQGGRNNRYITCSVYYNFDKPLDQALILERIKDLINSYKMFNRNIIEINKLPYWQKTKPDWNKNFYKLRPEESIEQYRALADFELSQPSTEGEGAPLFRVYLTHDQKQLVFIWHHVISDFEGMLNKHALHLFETTEERTKFGYQLKDFQIPKSEQENNFAFNKLFYRSVGSQKSDFNVNEITLPVKDIDLYEIGLNNDLSMSDVFSFITARAIGNYYESLSELEKPTLPIISPLSLRKNSLALDEGNNRAIKKFPIVFPMEPIAKTYERFSLVLTSSGSYDQAGQAMKFLRRTSIFEMPIRRISAADFISNYFPLADMELEIGDSSLIDHNFRVPLMPFERTKFAWSNYDGKVVLFLHTDPILIQSDVMTASANKAIEEVLSFLRN